MGGSSCLLVASCNKRLAIVEMCRSTVIGCFQGLAGQVVGGCRRRTRSPASVAEGTFAFFPRRSADSLFSIIISRRKPPAAGDKGDGKLVNHRDALPLARDAALFT